MFPASNDLQNFTLVYNKTSSRCNSSVSMDEAKAHSSLFICDDIMSPYYQMQNITKSNMWGIFIHDYPLYEVSIPGVVISSKDASAVISYARNASNPIASLKFNQTFLHSVQAPAVAYSSTSPSFSYQGILKPDIIAPGFHVLASWVPNLLVAGTGPSDFLFNGYNILSGTSAACAQAASVVVLLRGAHPEWSDVAIRSAIITTANPMDNAQNPIRDYSSYLQHATTLAMGAGQIDPNQALDLGLIYDATPQDYVNLLCAMNLTKSQILAITKSSGHNCSNPYFDLNYPPFIALYNDANVTSMVQKNQGTVTNVGKGSTTYTAMVTAPEGSAVQITPKRLVFAEKYEKKSYTVTIEYKGLSNQQVSSGALVWVEENGEHTVRSPIVVAPMMHFVI
jgi:hypothetical protein